MIDLNTALGQQLLDIDPQPTDSSGVDIWPAKLVINPPTVELRESTSAYVSRTTIPRHRSGSILPRPDRRPPDLQCAASSGHTTELCALTVTLPTS